VCGDGSICTDTETCDDSFVDNCGACDFDCNGGGTGQSHNVCYPGCADGTAEQGFSSGMVGCAGSVTWANRNTLCAPGYDACTATEWNVYFDGKAPTHHYWTSTDLHYNGGGINNCFVSTTVGSTCPGNPMRVCKPGTGTSASTDPEGNDCNWWNCGYGATTPNHFYGGCAGNTTAGTLCCPKAGCSGKGGFVDQAFKNGLVGCAGQVSYANRATLCAAGCTVATAAQWNLYNGGQEPSYHYWVNEALDWGPALNGGVGNCFATTSGSNCGLGAGPMHVCVDSTTYGSTDPLGNTCNWSECGYTTVSPNQHYGGCSPTNTAGTLCFCP
jgi:hypothetical protein